MEMANVQHYPWHLIWTLLHLLFINTRLSGRFAPISLVNISLLNICLHIVCICTVLLALVSDEIRPSTLIELKVLLRIKLALLFYKIKNLSNTLLKFLSFPVVTWCPTKKLDPIGSAILTFIGYKQTSKKNIMISTSIKKS